MTIELLSKSNHCPRNRITPLLYDHKKKHFTAARIIKTLHFLSNEVLLLSSAVGAVAIQDSFLYVCGGFDGISSLDTVERYDPDLDSWKNIARMNKNRSAAGVVHLDGKIYSLGGHNGLSIFESVEFYDTRRGILQ